jgi:hypothetical protein
MGSPTKTEEQSEDFLNANNGVQKQLLVNEYNNLLNEHEALRKELVGAVEHCNAWIDDYNNYPHKRSNGDAELIEGLQENVQNLQSQVDESNMILNEKLKEIESL